MKIEQAIFTSAQTEHGDGYQLVAQSSGVSGEQARELAVWGPSHDALCRQRDEPSSVNFHRLSCGTSCVSKTVAAGEEYSGRGGARIYTQFLLVPTELLARFANNPFAVLRAAWAKGMLEVHEKPPTMLEPFTLAGRTAIVDDGLLAQWAGQLGAGAAGRFISAAMSPGIQLVAGAGNYETLFGGLLNCFPVECRTELTFTTGLRYSPRRPFRLAPLVGDAAEKRHAERCEGVSVLDLAAANLEAEPKIQGWAEYVAEAIRLDQLHQLADVLEQSRAVFSLAELNQLGQQSLARLRSGRVTVVANAERSDAAQADVTKAESGRMFRTDRPSEKHAGDSAAIRCGIQEKATEGELPSQTCADVASVELLEQLENAICEAVSGAPAAMEEVGRIWKAICVKIQPGGMAKVREHYLRYALTLWHACSSPVRQPQCAVQVLDLVEVIFKVE